MEPTAMSFTSAVNIMTILFSIVSSQFRECNRKLEAYSKSFSLSTYFCTNHEGSSENWAFFFQLEGRFFKCPSWEGEGREKEKASTFPRNFCGSDPEQGN